MIDWVGAKRKEYDALGEIGVPEDAYWGPETERARLNFTISGRRMPGEFIRALGLIKAAAAEAAGRIGLLEGKVSGAVAEAAREVAGGTLEDQFPVDIFQTGSGTSTNMNMNEVIASRATEILTGAKFPRAVHPNDTVNIAQSSNDVIPSAMNISAYLLSRDRIIPSLLVLKEELDKKAREFESIVKIGRTHLQDAVPVGLGQEFGGYAALVRSAVDDIGSASRGLLPLPLGGTAVGTGINLPDGFIDGIIEVLRRETGEDFAEASDHFGAQSTRGEIMVLSSSMRNAALVLRKIAEDLRWMNSGPESGLAEISLPALQPGSSIMPGKVNPVIPEAVILAAAHIVGLDASNAFLSTAANFELHTGMPLLAANIIDMANLLSEAALHLGEKAVRGLVPNRERIRAVVERSSALSTALVPVLGHEKAVEIARRARAEGRTVREVVIEEGILTEGEAGRILDPSVLIRPGRAG